MEQFIYQLIAACLVIIIGGAVFYNLMPLVFTDPTLRSDIRKLKAYIWLRLRKPWAQMTELRYYSELGGYVHDTTMTKFIPPHTMQGTVAAWTFGAGQVSNSYVFKCDATDEVAVLTFFIDIWSNSAVDAGGNPIKGSLLKSIELDFEVLIAALDAMSAVIYKAKRGADGADVVMSTPTFTYDSGHDSAAERIDIDEHKMTLTLDTPAYIENDEYYRVDVSFDKAATSTVEVLGAFANFTFRA